ncbi:DinB family protein [Propioniciclava sp.]|uniref:DinB family protein n=1 Tax=Propioniciclava sp. TaxID=2038686 RepID=UPI00260B18A9|nr:DinB family protein [Propioniciclava sp.]
MSDFTDADLRGARFVRTDLSGAVLRGVMVDDVDIDAPWLLGGGGVLRVNGVDVTGYVDAELNRRFPGRELRRPDDLEGLRTAWAAVEAAWAKATARAATMAPGVVDEQVDGEWSFAQTLRHLVMATDTWLRGAVLGVERPYHPLGQPNVEYYTDGYDPAVFASGTPPYAEVLAIRAERQAMVRDFLGDATPELLAETRPNPWGPQHRVTVLSCLRTILEEEWEHLRYATRDLDTLASRD